MRNSILLSIASTLFFLQCGGKSGENLSTTKASEPERIEIIARDLEVPWGMDFLPDGRLLLNERPGRINILNLRTNEKKLLLTREIWDRAEGGLLGLTVDPQFEQNHFVFIYETVESGNRIVRLVFENETLRENKIILDSIPKKLFHDGGVIRFGPDGYLYAGTGDARTPENAQDIYSLSGKILRMDRDGAVPPDNPFHNYVWTYGHRNVQGICWDENGAMYATEHGPSGELHGWCCHDEFNKIEKGHNYGWPFVIGDDNREGMMLPLAHSGEDTWAPGGIAYVGDHTFLVACLRGTRLLRIELKNEKVSGISDLYNEIYGRLRNVIVAPDGSILFCSSNRDGRGDVLEGDDKIYRIR